MQCTAKVAELGGVMDVGMLGDAAQQVDPGKVVTSIATSLAKTTAQRVAGRVALAGKRAIKHRELADLLAAQEADSYAVTEGALAALDMAPEQCQDLIERVSLDLEVQALTHELLLLRLS